MSAKPINMLQLRRILQLLNNGFSERSISKQTTMSRNTISEYKARIQTRGISYADLLALDDEVLFKNLFDPEQNKTHQADRYLDLQNYIKELEKEPDRVKKILTKKLLWLEYKERYSEGYCYSRFCDYLFANERLRDTVMHFFHKPAEKMMIDFAGTPFICKTSEGLKKYQVFLAVLSYSGYTYVQATESQNQYDLLNCMENALKYFGGASQVIISDNLKSCVKKYDRFEPELTELMDQFCMHYQTAILPARPRKPKDKPTVERHVRLVYERIYAPLRNKSFIGLKEVNEDFMLLCQKHNGEKFRLGDKTRLELFEEFEKHLLIPLPSAWLDVNKRVKAKVAKDYHVWHPEDKHFYSVPHQQVGKEVTIVYNSITVEIYIGCDRIAVHAREYKFRGFTTNYKHMPISHYEYSQQQGWTAEKFCSWAASISADTKHVIEKIITANKIKQQSFQACMGILQLGKRYGKDRLAKACSMAFQAGVYRYKFISNILKNNMDVKNFADPATTQIILDFHENNRNPAEYK